MSDIVERLRNWPRMTPVACTEAAEEIERLRADLAWCREQGEMQDRVIVKLTAALREIAALPHTICHSVMIARAALEGK